MQSPLRFLAIGDSLTAGYFEYGLSNHPYSINLTKLFNESNIPIIIDQQGRSGEHVVPSMVRRLENLLKNWDYDWIIILGGINDLGYRKTAEDIFNQGLKLMYDMILQQTNIKSKLVAMTLIQTGCSSPDQINDTQRQNLNQMIINYIENCPEQDRVTLVDLDKSIPYHSIDDNQRDRIWDDLIHLKPYGYDQMAHFIFQEISKKIQKDFSKK